MLLFVLPHKGIPLSNKKKQTTDTCNYVHEPQNHYLELRKSNSKEHTLYDSTYKKFKNNNILWMQKSNSSWLSQCRRVGVDWKGHKQAFWSNENLYILIGMVVYLGVEICQHSFICVHWICAF